MMLRMKNIIPIVAAIVLILGAPSIAYAQAEFSRMGFGAYGLAMSNAMAAETSGATSPYYNPALTPFATGQSLEASVALMRFDRQLQFLQFSAPLKPRAGIAVGLVHGTVGKIDGRDNSGFHTGFRSTSEFAFFLSFGLRFSERVTGGLSLQLFRSDLADEINAAASVGIDVGLTARITESLVAAMVVDDLLGSYDWDTAALFGEGGQASEDKFPSRYRLGLAYDVPGQPLTVTGEYEIRVDKREARSREIELLNGVPTEITEATSVSLFHALARFGSEYRFNELISLRAGVDQLRTATPGAVRPSFGVAVQEDVGSLRVGGEYTFALESFGVGAMHVISLKLFL